MPRQQKLHEQKAALSHDLSVRLGLPFALAAKVSSDGPRRSIMKLGQRSGLGGTAGGKLADLRTFCVQYTTLGFRRFRSHGSSRSFCFAVLRIRTRSLAAQRRILAVRTESRACSPSVTRLNCPSP